MHNPRAPLDLLLRKFRQHVQLSEEDCEAIRSLPYQLRTLEPGAYTVREGDIPTHCAVLISGFAYRHKLTGEGARQIVSVHIPGEPLDFQNLFLDVADHNVQMLSRAEVAMIPREAVMALARGNEAVGFAILVLTLVESAIFREWVINIGRRDAKTRMAHILCEFAIRLEAQEIADEYSYELPMTQEQLADAVGLTPVHVNRTLKLLEQEGYITRSRRQVTIPQWKRLREVGDFNARYLHLEPLAPPPG